MDILSIRSADTQQQLNANVATFFFRTSWPYKLYKVMHISAEFPLGCAVPKCQKSNLMFFDITCAI